MVLQPSPPSISRNLFILQTWIFVPMNSNFPFPFLFSMNLTTLVSEWVKVAQLCPTLCSPKDCSLPGSSVRGILQAGILEWVAFPFSRGSSQPRDRTQVSRIEGRLFTIWATQSTSYKWNYMEFVFLWLAYFA